MHRSILTLLALGSGLLTAQAHGQQQPFATLAEHARLPARAIIAPSQDAPESLKVSWKDSAADRRREDRLEANPGISCLSDRSTPRRIGASLPFKGHSLQAFSGINSVPDGTLQLLSDYRYGSEADSPDTMMMFLRG